MVSKEEKWYSFTRRNYNFQGRESIIVEPRAADDKKNWVWRARFFGVEPQVDLALLELGFHLVYTDVSDWFGAPKAVEHWNKFYDHVTSSMGLNKKVVLEGFSRGGLIVYNWASANTGKVACIYVDAPVCDFNSWPRGKGKAEKYPEEWDKCLEAYGITEEESTGYKGLPLYNCVEIARANIPVLHVCGTADEVVPFEENSLIVEEKIKDAGGNIMMILKEGMGHHPHCLPDPSPIVDFILENLG
jgi:pimeloyl-ACP methyl ester carboxylesterase